MSDKPTDLSEYLKAGLDQAVQEYVNFKKNDIPTDAKGFTAYHNACKAVLTHIALLMKLIQGTHKPTETMTTDWIEMAERALGKDEDSDEMLFD